MDGEGNDEILALESIYGDQISIEDVDGGKRVGITIHPATGDDPNSQYVCLDLSLLLPQKYPLEPPKIYFSKSRGLSETSLSELESKMQDLLKDRTSECVFDLLEMAKEELTFNNIPSCLCSICLSGFHEGDDFLKTECFHYFHCFCLNNYKLHLDSHKETENEQTQGQNSIAKTSAEATVPCPVCRLPVVLDLELIHNASQPLDNNNWEIDKGAVKSHYEKFNEIYQKQLKNGGLIDLEHEQNKYLLSNIQQAYASRKKSEGQDVTRQDKETEESRYEAEKLSQESSLDNTCSVPSNINGGKGKLYFRPQSASSRRHWNGNGQRKRYPDNTSHLPARNGAHDQPQFVENQRRYGKSNWRRKNYNHPKSEPGDPTPSASHTQHKAESAEKNGPACQSFQLETQNDSLRTTYRTPRSYGNGRQGYSPRSHYNRTQNHTATKDFRPKGGTNPRNNSHKIMPEYRADQNVSRDSSDQKQPQYPKHRPQNKHRNVDNRTPTNDLANQREKAKAQ